MKINNPQIIYGANQLSIGSTGILIETSGTNYGISYSSDFRNDYTNRSLIDKEYVNSFISSGEWNPPVSNELNCTVSNIKSLYSKRGTILNLISRFSYTTTDNGLTSKTTSFSYFLPSPFEFTTGILNYEMSISSYDRIPNVRINFHDLSPYFNPSSLINNELIFRMDFDSSGNDLSTDLVIKVMIEAI